VPRTHIAFVRWILVDDHNVPALSLRPGKIETSYYLIGKFISGHVFDYNLSNCDYPAVLQANVEMSSRGRTAEAVVDREEV